MHFHPVLGVSKYIVSDISFGTEYYAFFLSCFGVPLPVTYHVVCASGMQALFSPVFTNDLDSTVLRAKYELGSSKEA